MVNFKLFTIYVILLFSFENCSQRHESENLTQKPFATKYSRGFNFEKTENGFALWTINPANKEEIWQKFWLFRDGKMGNVPKGFTPIAIPIKHCAVLSSVFGAFIEELGGINTIKAVDDTKYFCSNELQKHFSLKQIISAGRGNGLNIELLISAKPDVVFTYDLDQQSSRQTEMVRKAKIQWVNCQNYLEKHALNRAEWILFFGLFFDQLDNSRHFFESISEHYELYQSNAKSKKYKPLVLANFMFNGTWDVGGVNHFQSSLVSDAGGIWFDTSRNIGNRSYDFEQIFSKAGDATIWINPGGHFSLNSMEKVEPKCKNFKAYKTGMVFNNNKWQNEYGGNAYWSYGVLRPDLVLADLIKIFHPEDMQSHTLVFYQQLK